MMVLTPPQLDELVEDTSFRMMVLNPPQVDGWVDDTSFRVSCHDDGPDPTSVRWIGGGHLLQDDGPEPTPGRWMGGGHFLQGLLSG